MGRRKSNLHFLFIIIIILQVSSQKGFLLFLGIQCKDRLEQLSPTSGPVMSKRLTAVALEYTRSSVSTLTAVTPGTLVSILRG